MRYAICNETFGGWDHARVCRFVAGLGYTGLELAPFTLAERITDVPAGRRRELRLQAEDSGLEIIGLHWLLAKTTGLMLTSPEEPDVIRRVDHPAFRLHLDVKAMSTESSPAPELIRRHRAETYHFHANDPNRRGPGFGETDFVPIFRALKEADYRGWVSVEVF